MYIIKQHKSQWGVLYLLPFLRIVYADALEVRVDISPKLLYMPQILRKFSNWCINELIRTYNFIVTDAIYKIESNIQSVLSLCTKHVQFPSKVFEKGGVYGKYIGFLLWLIKLYECFILVHMSRNWRFAFSKWILSATTLISSVTTLGTYSVATFIPHMKVNELHSCDGDIIDFIKISDTSMSIPEFRNLNLNLRWLNEIICLLLVWYEIIKFV